MPDEEKTLLGLAGKTLERYPDFCVLAGVLILNLLVMGPVAGYGLQPARKLDWFYAHPFGSTYSRIDALSLGLATAQVSLVTVWSCFSRRLAVLRFVAWLAATAILSITLLAFLDARFTFLRVPDSVGLVVLVQREQEFGSDELTE